MKKIVLFSIFSFIFSCSAEKAHITSEATRINNTLDAWHKAAAEANFNNYFQYFTEDAIFIGTDATENWNKTNFAAFAKLYFDKGKAWNFTALERHVFFDASGKTAWFDELLNTHMKICRGSGVLVKSGNDWKIAQYVLSMTMPNDKIDAALNLKAVEEDSIINALKKK